MTTFSQADGIDDKLTDTIGVLAKKVRSSRSRNLAYKDLRTQLDKAIQKSKYLVFTANVTNYGTWRVGHSKLFYVPETRRGALSIFHNKTIRLVCIGSGRYTRLLAAAVVKLEPRIHLKVLKQFKLRQESLIQKKSKEEAVLLRSNEY